MNHCIKSKLNLALAGFLLAVFTMPANAQDLPDDERATFIFEVDVDQLLSSELGATLGPIIASELLELDDMFPGIELEDISKVRGQFEFSETWESVENVGPGAARDLPIDFQMQMAFNSESFIEDFEETIQSDSQIIEENGKKYYAPPEDDFSPTNIRVHFDGKLVEFATSKYAKLGDREFMTAELEKTWKSLPENTGAKVALDIEASRELLNGFKETIQEEFGAMGMIGSMVKTTLKFVDETQSLGGYVDLSGEKLLSLSIAGSDDKANSEIEGVLNGLLFMGAMPLEQLFKTFDFENEKDVEPLLQLAEQLKAEKRDQQVVIEIVKPESFDEIAKSVYFPKLKHFVTTSRMRDDLQTIARAAINYSLSNDESFPFQVAEDSPMNQNLSWRVRTLNFGYTGTMYQLSEDADVTESWEHSSNQEIIKSMPSQFGPDGENSNLVWVKTKVKKRQDLTDPFSETIMLLRLPKPTENKWTQPGDDISMIKVIQMVSKLKDDEYILAATYSGSIVSLDNTWDHNRLKSYLTPASGDNN